MPIKVRTTNSEYTSTYALLDTESESNLIHSGFAKKLNLRKSHKYEEGQGIPQNFCLVFINGINKQLFIKETVEQLNIYNIVFETLLFYMCTKNHNHMRYRVRKPEFFVILGHFLSFLHPYPNNWENHNFEKMKKASCDIIFLHMCTKNHNHRWMLPEIWNATDIILCRFGPFFALLPHYWPQKLKFRKNVYYLFAQAHPK